MTLTINPNPFHIKLQSNQNELVIGDTNNMSSVNSAFVSKDGRRIIHLPGYNPRKFSSVMAPTSNNKSVFDLTVQDTATKINIRPAFQLAKPGNYTTTVLADGNDSLEFTRTPGNQTKTNITIPKVELLETGQVAVSFKVTREASPKNSNTVRVIATIADMEKLLSGAKGLTLTSEARLQVQEGLKNAKVGVKKNEGSKESLNQVQSGSNETLVKKTGEERDKVSIIKNTSIPVIVKKTGEERGKVSPEVAEHALNCRAMLYGKDHKSHEKFIEYRKELETGGYTVTEADGKYTVKVTEKAAETSRSNDNVPIVPDSRQCFPVQNYVVW